MSTISFRFRLYATVWVSVGSRVLVFVMVRVRVRRWVVVCLMIRAEG